MKNSQKGFTLVELLVVIAIIGILSSVVLSSLTTARSKGSDAAVQSELSNMRAQAELYFSNNGSTYGVTTGAWLTGTNCTAIANNLFGSVTIVGSLKDLFTDLISKTGNASNVSCSVNAAGTAWAAQATTSSGSFCVDSTGKSAAVGASTTLGYCNE